MLLFEQGAVYNERSGALNLGSCSGVVYHIVQLVRGCMMKNRVGKEATGKIPKLRGFLPHSSVNVAGRQIGRLT